MLYFHFMTQYNIQFFFQNAARIALAYKFNSPEPGFYLIYFGNPDIKEEFGEKIFFTTDGIYINSVAATTKNSAELFQALSQAIGNFKE